MNPIEKIINAYSYKEILKDLKFVFIHNDEELEGYEELIRQSHVKGKYKAIDYYIIYNGKRINVVEGTDGYYIPSRSKKLVNINKIEDEINDGLIPVYHEIKNSTFFFGIPSKENMVYDYITLMIYKPFNKIIGYYLGELEDNCSIGSYVKIRPDFTGKGLCKPLSAFTYCSLINIGVKCIEIVISTSNPMLACSCYLDAAWVCGLRIYWEGIEVDKYFCLTREFIRGDKIISLVK